VIIEESRRRNGGGVFTKKHAKYAKMGRGDLEIKKS